LRRRLDHLLSGLRDPNASCPLAKETPTISGEYEIESEDGSPAVLLYMADARFALATRTLAAALNQPGGWLDTAVNSTTLSARARAVGLGSPSTVAGLGISLVAADQDALTRGIAQVRGLIDELKTLAP